MKKIVIRFPNWIGDFIMALPVLEDIKKNSPFSVISVLLKEHLKDLLKNNPHVDEITFLKKSKKETIKTLKDKNFDCGLLLTNSFSSAYLFYKANIKNKIGYRKDFRSIFLNKSLKFDNQKIHQIQKYKKLLKFLNIDTSNTKPKLYIDEPDKKTAKKILLDNGYNKEKKIIAINPFAAYGIAKCWPIDRYKKLASKILDDDSCVVVFIGDQLAREPINEICDDLLPRAINLAGKTTLNELVSVINEADLFITNDSGPMHIASALKKPLIAIFGSTSEILTGPYHNEIIINKNVNCSPCFKRVCPIDFRCMKSISVDDVFKKTKECLDAKENN